MLVWEGRQGAEAALVSGRTTVPLSAVKIVFPRLLGSPGGSQFFESALFTPNPSPTPQQTQLSTCGEFPPQKAIT